MSGAEVIVAISLIDACIGITKTIIDIGRAVQDAQGLPPKLRALCDQLPAIEDLLESAHDRCDEGKVTQDASNSAEPILRQCEQALGELRDIFRKVFPKDGDNRGKRVWKGAKAVVFGRDSQLQKLLGTIQDNLKLLEQRELYVIGDKLDALQQITEGLAQDDGGKYTHSGKGNIIANEGGTPTNYVQGGEQNRQVNNPGVYHEGPAKFVDRKDLFNQINAKLSAPGARAALQSVRDIADLVKIQGRNDPSANIFTLFRSWLRDERMGRWMIVLDNADDASFLVERDSRPGGSVLECLPNVEHGTVLITSRSNAAAARLVDRRDMIDVHPMDEEHALTLLEKRLGQQTNRTELLALASALDFMPLAITQATAYIKSVAPRCSVPQYLEQLERSSRSKTNLLSANSEELRRDHEAKNSIMLALQISFEHLYQFRRSAADLLSLMSFYHHQEIPEFLLPITPQKRPAFTRPLPSDKKASGTFARLFRRKSRNPSINASEMEARTADEEHDATEASYDGLVDHTFEQDIITLHEYHFISVSPGGATFEMHRLVQLAAQMWLEASGRYQAWAKRSIRNLDAAFPDPEYKNWGKCRILYPHANLALDLKLSGRNASLSLASVLYKAGWFMLEQGQLKPAEAMSRRALEIRERILRKEHPHTLHCVDNLALVLEHQGKYEAAKTMFRRVLEASERVLGKEHPTTLSSLNNLANVLQQQGKYEAAETIYRRVLEARERVLEKEHPNTLTSVNNLANVLQQQGKYEVAEAMTPIDSTGHDDRALATIGVDASASGDSDAEDDVRNPQTGESYNLANAGSSKKSDRANKGSRVVGGKAVLPKRVVVDYDSDDGRIITLKQQGFSDDRWLRLRKALEAAENERMDDELSDWHEDDDAKLQQSIKDLEDRFEADLEKLMEKKWVEVAASLALRINKKKYSSRACRERFEGLENGTALLPIEQDKDQEGRKRLREERMAAAKHRRATAIADARREEEDKAARLEAKKTEALEKRQAVMLLAEKRAAENAKQDGMRKKRAEDRDRMRLAKRTAEAQASAELKWKTTQRVAEKALWEEMVGKNWRSRTVQDPDSSAVGDADAEDDSDASEASDAEVSDKAHKHHRGLLGGFSLMQDYVPKPENIAPTPAKVGKTPTAALVTAETMADPRSDLAVEDLNAILRVRGLPAKNAEESRFQAIARLCAADKDMSTADLHDTLRRYFIKIKGTRQEKLRAVAEYEAGEL
ncbi:hypothetical protein B0A54_00328 [Friedmanniomyces endolithicus]|uniref:NACHT-NTPase and P-loop NTPases N-terminal domain-containing protein n=1 Tax=Friedmanniomyces endolithicus TaxID=329885 RepID=A0A4U0VK32_9PEZI|nr:hypothetical protein B0A54_00328 [Friedmanniomyces endolithicus]